MYDLAEAFRELPFPTSPIKQHAPQLRVIVDAMASTKAQKMENDTRIETDRLRLRTWREGDFEQYEQACNTPNVMRWLGGVQTRSQIKADMFFFSASLSWHNVTFWVVERKSDHSFLGFCGLVQIPDRDCPIAKTFEIGWRLRESVWRQGYGYEAASAVLDLAFKERRVEAVYSRAAPGNTASRRLMAKLGLRRRREFDYVPAGEGEKLFVHSISADEWRELRQGPD